MDGKGEISIPLPKAYLKDKPEISIKDTGKNVTFATKAESIVLVFDESIRGKWLIMSFK